MIIDLILGSWIEAGAIGTLLLGNAVTGFRQEGQAQKTLAMLRPAPDRQHAGST